MNFYVKIDWIDYLNSGRYDQGSDYMRYVDGNNIDRYDALGVLCQLFIDKHSHNISNADWWDFYDYIEKKAHYNLQDKFKNIEEVSDEEVIQMTKDGENDIYKYYKGINPHKKPYFFYDETMYLPKVVCDWAELSKDPFIMGKRMTSSHDIFNLSFEDISKAIDKEL